MGEPHEPRALDRCRRLVAVALLGGVTEAFVPGDQLAAQHGGERTGQTGAGSVKALGILELLAATGLIPLFSHRRIHHVGPSRVMRAGLELSHQHQHEHQ
ncbi:hypothetical protein ACWFRJ_42030 [Streptomyces sp. NPDC055239]